MGKDSHFTGQPVYSQVLKLLDHNPTKMDPKKRKYLRWPMKVFAMADESTCDS